jgi:hypothetical protein
VGIESVFAVTAVGSQFAATKQAQKAANAERKAAKIERRGAEIQNTAARRRAIREAIILQAAYTAQAGAGGGLGGSSVQQQLSSVQTQLGANVALQGTLEKTNTLRLRQLDKAMIYNQQAKNWSALGGLYMTGLSMYSPSMPTGGAQPPQHIPRGP